MSTIEGSSLIGARGIENLSPAGRRALVDIARFLLTDPDFLAVAMSFETSGTFSPGVKNAAGSGAVGMIQFMPSTAAKLGYTSAQIAAMSQDEQIRGPVYKYLAGHRGRLNSVEDVYLAIFYPAAMGQSDDFIIGNRDGSDFQQAVYRQNAGFDSAGSGVIRRGDVLRSIRGAYQAALARPRVPVPASELWQTLVLFGLFGITSYGIVQWGRGKLR